MFSVKFENDVCMEKGWVRYLRGQTRLVSTIQALWAMSETGIKSLIRFQPIEGHFLGFLLFFFFVFFFLGKNCHRDEDRRFIAV